MDETNVIQLDSGDSKIRCAKCGRLKAVTAYFTHRDGSKWDLCKDCLTLHIDNFKPETYLWILEKQDIPYIEEEWEKIRSKEYAKNPKKFNGASVIGKYISKMKLGQFNKYHWNDNEKLKAEAEEQRRYSQEQAEAYQQSIKEQYERGDITEAEYRTLVSTQEQYEADLKERQAEVVDAVGANNAYREDNFIDPKSLPDPAASLTQEDKIYLAMKWGQLYKPSEWIELETKYNEMMGSFDIQDSDTKSSLILICKTYLKMNQAIDEGDVESYQKLSRVYNDMRKSAKFTAAQNKEERGADIDCIGELVLLCEKAGGFIPRYLTDAPQDKVDMTLKNMNEYTHNLVVNDLGIGDQIEQQLKKMQIQAEMEAAEAADQQDKVLSDEEIAEYYDDIEEQRASDSIVYYPEEEDENNVSS